MSVSNYLGTCRYSIDELKPFIFLLPSSKIEDKVYIDDGAAYISSIEEEDILKVLGNTNIAVENSLNERWTFSKTVNISILGYYGLSNINEKYYIVVENMDGTQFMVNQDFPSVPSYTYTIDSQTNQTNYTFTALGNMPILELKTKIDAIPLRHCRYWSGGISKLQLIEKGKSVLDEENRTVNVSNNDDIKLIQFNRNSCSFTETFDGNNFNTSLSFSITLDDYKSSWQYNLLEFNDNRYSAIITPSQGENVIYAGFNEFGLTPSYSIGDESTYINISLIGNSKSVFTEPYDSTEDAELYWVGVSSVTTDRGEYMTAYECSSTNGYAKYLLLKEINQFGEETGRYKALEGYEEDYDHFINIVGTFDNEILFPNNDCIFHCSTISSIPNLIVFSAVTSYTYTVNSLCDWNITHNLPSGVTINPISGESGITNITISCNDIGTNEGLYTLVLHTAEEDIPTQVSVRLSQNESYYKEIDARRQNVYFTTAFNLIDLQSGDIDKISAYEIENNIIKIVIPRNDSTQSRVFELHGINMYGSLVDFYIEQYGIIQEWREEDDEYICVGGDLYTVATLWTGYTQADLRRTNEQRAETMSVPRSEECEQYYKWQWNGDTVCVDGDLYQQLTEMRSSDGYEWFETENTMQGDLIERYSLECAENVYSISAYTTDEVGSSIWTTMIVNINGNITRYSDVSAITFSVAEGCPFTIEFAEKENYFRPFSIMATATTDTAYTGVYTSSRGINIGVKTIDENRNYIITDIEVCVNNSCRTYQNTSAVTFNTRPNDNFEVNFGNVSGYETPSSITSVSTADVDYFAVYELEGVKYNINVNIEDGSGNRLFTNLTVCNNGDCNFVENVSSYTFVVRENCEYSIQFDNKYGYTTPATINGIATGDTTHTAVYQQLPSYAITVNTVDDYDVPLLSNYTICINGSCNTYQNVSSYTFNVMQGLSYSISFGEKQGYTTPSQITGVSTGNTTHTAVYNSSTVIYKAILTLENETTAYINYYNNPTLTITEIEPYRNTVVSAIITNVCETIGQGAFNYCQKLRSVLIPNSVTSIGQQAFQQCWELTGITIPNSVTHIGDYAFDSCYYNFAYAIIGTGVTNIGDYVFNNCENLTSVTIPNTVTSIGNQAFSNCQRLSSITIPNSVISIDDMSFEDCLSLSSIVVDSNNTVYDSRDNCNAVIETSSNTLVVGGVSTVIPNTVTSIGGQAFRRRNITSITIPNNVVSIGEYAFAENTTLVNVILGNGITILKERAFYFCDNLTSITSNATTAPTLENNALSYVASSGTLYYPTGSDYSTWISALPSGWTATPIP